MQLRGDITDPKHVLLAYSHFKKLFDQMFDKNTAYTNLGAATDYNSLISGPQAIR